MDFLPTLDSGKSSYQVNISALCVPHLDFFSRKNLTVLTAYVATLHYVPNSCRDVDPAKKKKKNNPAMKTSLSCVPWSNNAITSKLLSHQMSVADEVEVGGTGDGEDWC